jgi:hypothetical protein
MNHRMVACDSTFLQTLPRYLFTSISVDEIARCDPSRGPTDYIDDVPGTHFARSLRQIDSGGHGCLNTHICRNEAVRMSALFLIF